MASDIRVIVVDDQRLIRESIAALLALQPGVQVVGLAANGREAIAIAQATLPDVVLMDILMPEMDGVAAAAELAVVVPRCRVVMLTTFDDEGYVRGALAAGASGYLLKDRPIEEIAAAVRTAHLGIAQLDPSALGRIVSARGAPLVPDGIDGGLTERELEVLRQLSSGATNREIARTLHLSEGTVKNHVSRILERLGFRHRAQAAVYARERGLLAPRP